MGVDVVGLPKGSLPEYLSKYKEDKYSDLGGLKEPDFEAINELNPDLIISSPSKRTKDTLDFFIKEFDYKGEIIFEESIYEAPYINILKVIKNIDDKHKTIFLFGHNPGFNDLADFLLGRFEDNIPTCGVLKLNFNISKWEDIKEKIGILEFFIYPKMFDKS